MTQHGRNELVLDENLRLSLLLMDHYPAPHQIGSAFLQKTQRVYDVLTRMYFSETISASQWNTALVHWLESPYLHEGVFLNNDDETVTNDVKRLVRVALQDA